MEDTVDDVRRKITNAYDPVLSGSTGVELFFFHREYRLSTHQLPEGCHSRRDQGLGNASGFSTYPPLILVNTR